MSVPDETSTQLRGDVLAALMAVTPSFESAWEAHLAYWGDDERGVFLDLGEYARHLVHLFETGQTDELPAIFAIVESLMAEGDEDCRGVTSVGFLETLQNIASHKPFGYEVFATWFGPESLKAWGELEELWNGNSSLADVIRKQRRSE